MKSCFCLLSCESQPKREARSEAKRSERKRTQARSEVHSRSSSRSIHPDQIYDLTSKKKVGMFAVVRNHHRVFRRRQQSASWSQFEAFVVPFGECGMDARHDMAGPPDRAESIDPHLAGAAGTCHLPSACGWSVLAKFLPIGDVEVTNLKFF